MGTQKIPRHMALEVQVLARDRHSNAAGLNRLMLSQPSLYNALGIIDENITVTEQFTPPCIL